MSFGKKVFDEAALVLADRRNTAEAVQREHHRTFAKRCPEFLIIERQMKESAFGVLKVIGMGSDARSYIEKLRTANLTAQNEIGKLLEENGLPKDYLEVPYTCRICSDTGFYEGKICECHKQLLKHIASEALAKSSPLRLSSFEDFDLSYYKGTDRVRMEQIFAYCKSYAEDFGMDSYSLLMTGETGLGKTHLSLAVAKSAIDKGFDVVYGSAQSFFSKIENEHFNRNKTDDDTQEMLTDCDLLIIDDLGAEFSTSFTVSVLYSIVNTRMLSGKPTVISTNLTASELESRYTRRITSRIMGEYQILEFAGDDIRQIKADNG